MNQKDMVNTIRRWISEGRRFRIGSRGICIDILPQGHNDWIVGVPRASYSVNVDTIEVIDVVESIANDTHRYILSLGVESGYVGAGEFDLTDYDTVKEIPERI